MYFGAFVSFFWHHKLIFERAYFSRILTYSEILVSYAEIFLNPESGGEEFEGENLFCKKNFGK